MREVDGMRVAFVSHDVYFAGLSTPSMYSTAKAERATFTFLLAPGKTEADVSDSMVREWIAAAFDGMEEMDDEA